MFCVYMSTSNTMNYNQDPTSSHVYNVLGIRTTTSLNNLPASETCDHYTLVFSHQFEKANTENSLRSIVLMFRAFIYFTKINSKKHVTIKHFANEK